MRVWSAARGGLAPTAALLLICLVAAGPLWGPGLVNTRAGGDSPFLLQRTHQLAANLEAGVFPVRWMPDAGYGLGYPFFSYYAALPYYLAGGLVVFGLDVLSAVKVTQTLFLVAAALAMYGWARKLLPSKPGALLAAAAYTLAPFHLVNLYVRGDSLSEFAAFAFYPLILWGLDQLSERPSARRAILAALAYAGLITTHNLSALIFSPFVLIYAGLLLSRKASRQPQDAGVARSSRVASVRRAAAWSGMALLLGILFSAWYWLPALGEMEYVQLTAQTTSYFHYSNHFRAADLVQTSLLFGYEIGPEAASPFAMGLVQAGLALSGSVVLIARRVRLHRSTQGWGSEAARWAFVLGGFVLTTSCITPLSRPLWDHLPLLEMVQFPWRFLSVQSLFAALLVGVLVTGEGRRGWLVALAVIVVLGLAQLGDLRPEHLSISSDEVTVERLQLYELFTGNIGTTVRHEYLPQSAVPRPYTALALFDPDTKPRAVAVSGELVAAEETAREATRRTWVVETGDGGAEVAFPVYYWPGWQAKVDDLPVELEPALDLGYATLAVPAGDHSVVIWLGRTPPRAAAEAVSAVAALFALVIVLRHSSARNERNDASDKGRAGDRCPQALLLGVPLLAVLVLVVWLAPRVSSESDDLTMDFEAMPYLHHNPGGVVLGPARLESYHYSSDEIAPGSPITVTLHWQEPVSDARAEVRLRAPGDHLNNTLRDLGAVTVSLDQPVVTATLEASGSFQPGPGLYLVSLSVSLDGTDGQSAEQVYLRPVWVRETAASDQLAALPGAGSGILRLHEGSVAWQQGGESLAISLYWSCTEPVAANYGLAFRLLDSGGNEWIRLDTQPGYGFLATSLWPAGRVIADAYVLPLPAGTPPGEGYSLTVGLYRVSTYEVAGEWSLAVALPLATEREDAPIAAEFGSELALSRLEVPGSIHEGDQLGLTAYWLALDSLSADYSAEWRLQGAELGYGFGLPLAAGSLPSHWPAGAYVAGRASLPVPSLAPPGEYVLSVTVAHPQDGAVGTYVHPEAVLVVEREREWVLPEMDREVGARFGDQIELAGYDLFRDGDAVELTLHWRALAAPEQDYKFFVHLADPVTGLPVAQIDTMPHGRAYPTGLWVTGEVVSDEVVLSLEDVPPGSYDLAVGWYSAETLIRLRATDISGEWLPGDRLILPEGVTVL